MFFSRWQVVYGHVISYIEEFGASFFRICLFGLLMCFLFLRVPYVYGVGGFCLLLLFFISPLFLSLFFSRLFVGGVSSFFCGFIPPGTPLWISPFVCLAETLSYVVRPFILMIRPFVNLTIGAFGGLALGGMCFGFGFGFVVGLVVLFMYEVFVALVHWFIVCNILSFSKSH
uniref:ATP synthase F0 subunit 6 n=1 Tax=Tracheophilus cymbius TaxID=2502951 RepID=A0A516IAA6_9TREM|nr:ATP synthase F0 subunit 6 [Tracheophilus cymbius]QDP13012.1 ATP synthase F0 subunit 6 [Tracheophilus cymbius]